MRIMKMELILKLGVCYLARGQRCPEVLEWKNKYEIAKSRKPVLLQGAPSAELCRGMSTDEILIRIGGVRAKKSNDTIFVHTDTSRTLLQDESVDSVSAEEGLASSIFSVNEECITEKKSASLPVRNELCPGQSAAIESYDMSNSVWSLAWLATENATTSTHYDMDHNFFTMLRGSKRFELWSPSQWTRIDIFPFFHQRNRQSHLEGVTPPFRPLPASDYNCTLNDSHVLYIPPYWFHRVSTLTHRSIALNAWSYSLENAKVANELNHAGHPPHTLPEAITLIHALSRFLNNTNLVSELLRTRYQPLFLTTFAHCDHHSFDPTRCPSPFFATKKKDASSHDDLHQLLDSLQHIFAQLFQQGDPSKAALDFISNEHHARSVAEIIAMDYIERVAVFLFGSDRACTFLRCLASSSSASG